MKNIAKSFTNIKLENHYIDSDIKIQQNILDKPRKVTDFIFCSSTPKLRKNPIIGGISKSVMELFDLDYNDVINDPNTPFYLSGTKLIPGSKPICNNYCGYQFGSWAGQLGDGRAHLLGNYVNKKKQYYQLQLKGSGLTPFSRHADGNSVVSSALREYIASQLMNSLGIPTTRAGSLIIDSQLVKRDPFYDGNITTQNAAIVLRVSPSFLRFGSFQICNQDAQCHKYDIKQNRSILEKLANFLIQRNYKHLKQSQQIDTFEGLFQQIVQNSAKLVAKWQSIGFVHGVLNTDNMSMICVTIDYGPFGFIDFFSKDYVSNATDNYERYSYRQQPTAVKWNLNRLAQSFDYLVPQNILKKYIKQNFDKIYNKHYYELMKKKLGIEEKEDCNLLIDQLIDILDQYGYNFTNIFTKLTKNLNDQQLIEGLIEQAADIKLILRNLKIYPSLLQVNTQGILSQDEGFNRYLIEDQPKRLKKRSKLQKITPEQYVNQQRVVWKEWLSKYRKYIINKQVQQKVNPLYVLRNDIAAKILKQLNKIEPQKKYLYLQKVLNVFENPFTKNQWFEQNYWNKKCQHLKLTCSS